MHPDTAFSDILARLERYGNTHGGGSENASNTSGPALETIPDEPLSPELVLVDPDLARRAREQLAVREHVEQNPPPQEPLFGFVQPPTYVLDRDARPRKRRGRRGRILRLLLLAMAGVVAFLGADPVKDFFMQSRERSAPPAGRVESPPRVSRGQNEVTSTPAPKGQPGSTSKTEPPHRSAKPQRRSVTPRPAQPPRVFAWVAVPNATYYLVEFYRGGVEIFAARPSSPRLLLPAAWTFKGRRYRLSPGRYRWSVRPGYGRLSDSRHGKPVVRAKLIVQSASGG